LTLQFGMTNYVNFAYGDFMTLGAYLTWTLNVGLGWPFWPALFVGALLMAIPVLFISQFVLEPFTRRSGPTFHILIVTFAVSLILSNLILAIWGGDFQNYNVGTDTPINLGPFILSVQQLGIIALAVTCMVAIHLLLTRTKLGKAMRAISDDKNLAAVTGIDTRRITTIVWVLSGMLAGLAGGVLALNVASFDPNVGVTFLFVIFAAVVFGGIGRPYGAMAGALVIGLVVEVSAVFIPSAYKLDVAFLVLMGVLLVRPAGLMSLFERG
jgi:branched-subunit amino acid ABC-type transport system permease component